jgi:predicted RNase H-like HicB family nuclease
VKIMSIKVNVIIQKEENWYVAKCIENSVASQGKTLEDALDNLKEALALYYEDETPVVETRQTFLTTMEVAI